METTTMKAIETKDVFNGIDGMRLHQYRKPEKMINRKNDYTVRPILSKVINEIDVNGTMFMVMYDRCNNHELSVLDMSNDGYYVSESDDFHHRNVGGIILSIPLDEIPAMLRANHDIYTYELISILKTFYKKYYTDIVESV